MAKILIVEDEALVEKMLREMIGCICTEAEVACAGHGEQAWNILKASGGQFDLVISDVAMPVMDGVTLTKRVREEYPGVRVILMSGRGAPEEHQAHVFLNKPFTVPQLLAAMQKPA